MAVAVMLALDPVGGRIFALPRGPDIRSPSDAEARPGLGGADPVDLDRRMRARGPLPFPVRSGRIGGRAGVADDALAADGEFERQRVRMRMSGEIVRADTAAIEYQTERRMREHGVAARLQYRAGNGPVGDENASRRRIAEQL